MAKPNDMMKKYDLFVFDWDGTLLSSLKTLRRLNEKFNPHWIHKKKVQSQRRKMSIGDPARFNIKNKMREREIEGKTLVPIIDFILFFLKPKLYEGTRQVLDTLKKRHKKIALFTNGADYRVLRELQHLGIEHYFDVIVSAQGIDAIKPNPLGLEAIIKSIGARKDRTLYIGDMVDDILMAKYAKVPVCSVTYGFDDKERLREMNPEYMIDSMEEFKRSL